jgi:hypothetical protein
MHDYERILMLMLTPKPITRGRNALPSLLIRLSRDEANATHNASRLTLVFVGRRIGRSGLGLAPTSAVAASAPRRPSFRPPGCNPANSLHCSGSAKARSPGPARKVPRPSAGIPVSWTDPVEPKPGTPRGACTDSYLALAVSVSLNPSAPKVAIWHFNERNLMWD